MKKNDSTSGVSDALDRSSKIGAASALATAVGLAAGTQAYASIQYTDIPDVQIGPNGSYNLDLNNDAVMDFAFQHQASFWSTTTTTTTTHTTSTASGGPTHTTNTVTHTYFNGSGRMTGNRVGVQNRVVTSGSDITPLDDGAHINSAANFSAGGYMAKFYASHESSPLSTSSAPWEGAWRGLEGAPRFVGLELHVGASTFYGWARMSVDYRNGTATLYDYAYEDNAGTGIDAGAIPEFNTLAGLTVGAASLLALRRRKKA